MPKIKIIEGDITDAFSVSNVIKEETPDEIYNLAAQSHVGTSFKQPSLTWDVTAGGVLNILEAIRYSGRKDDIKFYQSAKAFFDSKNNQRIILMTTKASISYRNFKFKKNDTILFGRESAGVPEYVHQKIKNRLKIPMEQNKRSLNIASSVAIILAESLRQTKWI